MTLFKTWIALDGERRPDAVSIRLLACRCLGWHQLVYPVRREKFLYACWHDVVWDPTPSDGLVASGNAPALHRSLATGARYRPEDPLERCLRW
jgi:hypothetical protein